ncbi:hypothetical protein [Mycobacterium avium]|uniref:hypothetical protein n=1 Tax=Mycobacterium avium TaxID=1764 RepID=UPI0020C7D708|nr:hypothetical protein [Mycobacterium avium]
MLVADLQHFLDVGPETPGPARALAEHLGGIVSAASAGDAHTRWGNRAAVSAPTRQPPLPGPHHGGPRRC